MPDFGPTLIEFVNTLFRDFLSAYGYLFRALSAVLESGLASFEGMLLAIPPVVFLVVVAGLVWYRAGWRLAFFSLVGLGFLFGVGMWVRTIETISLILFSTILSLIIAIPMGILASWSDPLDRYLRPVLDMMQTLPSFVYLVPAVMFFGMGKVAAIVATLIFAVPPPIRLTNLGIREVPEEMIEAAQAFGSTRWQTLIKVQLPAARATIMAGVNQCIMMALAMAVISSMIGARGLGGEVLRAVQRVNIGLSLVAGVGIVIIAILLDRLVQQDQTLEAEAE